MKEDFPLYAKWLQTTDWILDAADRFPKSVRATLSNRIVNLTMDVLELIVEALYSKNRRDKLDGINLCFEKLRVLFRIAAKRAYISEKQYEFISYSLNEAGKMTGGWRKTL